LLERVASINLVAPDRKRWQSFSGGHTSNELVPMVNALYLLIGETRLQQLLTGKAATWYDKRF
jgi:hypothetical protein